MFEDRMGITAIRVAWSLAENSALKKQYTALIRTWAMKILAVSCISYFQTLTKYIFQHLPHRHCIAVYGYKMSDYLTINLIT